ncbi:hypothetical protein [Chitinophaga pinensis]|uniref:hypothetical protein n=1 Tax=Chitinophaga pinensis TaxID=79329 RepID=UPI0016452F12|nr:hypothetical protein [Chitinophaga pinensis]
MIGILPRAKFNNAGEMLMDQFHDVIAEYPLEEERLNKRLYQLFPWSTSGIRI